MKRLFLLCALTTAVMAVKEEALISKTSVTAKFRSLIPNDVFPETSPPTPRRGVKERYDWKKRKWVFTRNEMVVIGQVSVVRNKKAPKLIDLLNDADREAEKLQAVEHEIKKLTLYYREIKNHPILGSKMQKRLESKRREKAKLLAKEKEQNWKMQDDLWNKFNAIYGSNDDQTQ